jgi:glycosyltransferase involved in cell wall biosynthesis
MSGGLVSVIMPAYDEEAFIAEALGSVLAQTYQPVEIVVVDDGSGDRTAEIAAAHDVHVLRRTHQGPAAARNAGLSVARGDYWMVFDADDVMPREGIAGQVAHLEQHPELDIVFGMTEAFVTPGEPRPSHFFAAWEHGSFPWHATTMLARRAALDRVGPFDETLLLGEDIDWLARAKEADVSIGHAGHVALRYRVHGANMTSDARERQHAMLAVLRRSVWRRRQPQTTTDDDE